MPGKAKDVSVGPSNGTNAKGIIPKLKSVFKKLTTKCTDGRDSNLTKDLVTNPQVEASSSSNNNDVGKKKITFAKKSKSTTVRPTGKLEVNAVSEGNVNVITKRKVVPKHLIKNKSESNGKLLRINSHANRNFSLLSSDMEAARIAIEQAKKVQQEIAARDAHLKNPFLEDFGFDQYESEPEPDPMPVYYEEVMMSTEELQFWGKVKRTFSEIMESVAQNNGNMDGLYLVPPIGYRRPKTKKNGTKPRKTPRAQPPTTDTLLPVLKKKIAKKPGTSAKTPLTNVEAGTSNHNKSVPVIPNSAVVSKKFTPTKQLSSTPMVKVTKPLVSHNLTTKRNVLSSKKSVNSPKVATAVTTTKSELNSKPTLLPKIKTTTSSLVKKAKKVDDGKVGLIMEPAVAGTSKKKCVTVENTALTVVKKKKSSDVETKTTGTTVENGKKIKKVKKTSDEIMQPNGEKKQKKKKEKKKVIEPYINPFSLFPVLRNDEYYPVFKFSNDTIASYLGRNFYSIGEKPIVFVDPPPKPTPPPKPVPIVNSDPVTREKSPERIFYKMPDVLPLKPDGTVDFRALRPSRLMPYHVPAPNPPKFYIGPYVDSSIDIAPHYPGQATRYFLPSPSLRQPPPLKPIKVKRRKGEPKPKTTHCPITFFT